MPKPSPAETPYHHGDLRNALIAEGRRLLEEVGARELSLRNVVRAVGVSIAAPSRHFEGKEGLLAAIAADGFTELAAQRRRITASSPDSLARVYRMLDNYVRFAQRRKGLFDLMVGPRILARDAYPQLAAASSESFDLFATAVSEYARGCGWQEKDLNLVVHSAWSTEHGIATLLIADRVPRADRPIDVARMVRFSLSLLLTGIAVGPAAADRIASALPPR
ncbi:MAG: hypothetical protein JWQ76_4516 [Ramlibacter sp.]|nr:hypothetical protein [Ramlibacter sp.]